MNLHALFVAYRDACRVEADAAVARSNRSTEQSRGNHRVAVLRRNEAEERLERAVREADREITKCRATHIELVEPGVYAYELRRG